MLKRFSIISAFLLLSACGASEDGSDSNSVSNNTSKGMERILSVSGNDADSFGGKLVLTEVAYFSDYRSSGKTVIATTDKLLDTVLGYNGGNSNLPFSDATRIVFIVTPFLISMRIGIADKSWFYDLACEDENFAITDCTEIDFDSTNRSITFTNTVAEFDPDDIESASTGDLTINGTITWIEGDEQ